MLTAPSRMTIAHLQEILVFWEKMLQADGNEATCDASLLSFLDPLGLCLMAHACHRAAQDRKRIVLSRLGIDIESYLGRMDVFGHCAMVPGFSTRTRADLRHALVEVKRVDSPAEIEAGADRLANAIIGSKAGMRTDGPPDPMTGYLPHEELLVPIKYIFSEALENALTHGRKHGHSQADVWIAAQYFPKTDHVCLAVIDNGCGFLKSLERHPQLPQRTHHAATRMSLRPRITCNPDLGRMDGSVNQGIGLTAIKEIAALSGGSMHLASGDSLLRLMPDANNDSTLAPLWQGVILYMELNRSKLRTIKIHEVIERISPVEEKIPLRFE